MTVQTRWNCLARSPDRETSMTFKHVLIGQFVPGEEWNKWLKDAVEFSNSINDVIKVEAKEIDDIVTIVCHWQTKEAWQRFWEVSRLDDSIEELFVWQAQHHTEVE